MKNNPNQFIIRHLCAFLIANICCIFSISLHADIHPSGQVRNIDNTIQWDWIYNTPVYSNWVIVGHDNSGSLGLDNYANTNGVNYFESSYLAMGYENGASGTMSISGYGAEVYFAYLYIGYGENSLGSFLMQNGTSIIFPSYTNKYIYVGNGTNSHGTMTLRDSDTLLRLSDHLYVGLNDGSHGQVLITEGAVFESAEQHVGYYAGSYGKITVDGPGSKMKTWINNKITVIGRNGTGELLVQNGGYVETGSSAVLGYSNGSQGTAEITGSGSSWTCSGNIYIGRGTASTGDPGIGILKAARGGQVQTVLMYVGYSSYNSQGTLDFTIGNTGTGVVNCGLIEADTIRLDTSTAFLQMHVDPGVNLTTGTQYTLVDYQTLGTTYDYKQFAGIDEGDIYTSPEGYNFRINYATDLGGGDLAITATVVDIPPCVVDVTDLYLICNHWLETGCSSSDWCSGADLDLNNDVNLGDFVYIAQNWLTNCPVSWPWQ